MVEKNTVIHPGQILLSEITKLGMKQKELAIRTGVSEKHISTIINGTKNISASFARKLDIALGAENGTWARYQAEYDLYAIRIEEENGISEEEINILKSMKEIVDYFLKVGIMHNHCGDIEKIIQLREFLRVNDLSVIPRISYNAAYRAQVAASTNINPYILFAWQRMCEITAEKSPISTQFAPQLLYSRIPQIKALLFEPDPNKVKAELKRIFSQCGIVFNVVHHFRGAPVQGFIKSLENGAVTLCLTIRGKKADKFWFSLFHEIGHLVSGDTNVRFVDFDSVKSEIENNADLFARDALIDPVLYRRFIESGRYHTLADIKNFSAYVGVPHWITIGRLHSDEWLEWSCYANEAPSYVWAK